MRRDKDIIGYLYNDTESKIRSEIARTIYDNHKISIACEHGCSCDDAIDIALGIPANELGYYPGEGIRQLEER